MEKDAPRSAEASLALLDNLDQLNLASLDVELIPPVSGSDLMDDRHRELWQWLDRAGYRVANSDPPVKPESDL